MNKIISNLFWKFAERIGSQLVSLILSTIIARILDPADYGTMVLANVVITILRVFVDSGLSTALIQKKDADDLDFSTIFYANIFLCILVYFVIYVSTPAVADYYARPDLMQIIRVLSLTLVISGFTNVQNAYVAKNMIFKRLFFATLAGTLFSGITGIIMAKSGYGVWSLVVQQISYALINTIVLWISVKWKPSLTFSFSRLRGLFSYSWKLLASALLDTGYGQLRQLMIAKFYSTEDLAYYSKGENFPVMLITNINASIDSILLPSMSEIQDDKESVKAMMRKSIKTAVFVLSPMLLGLAAVADKVILILLSEKWAESIPFMRMFCIIYLFYPIHTANLNAIKAMGRSDIFLKLEIIKKVVGISLIFISIRISVWAVCLSVLAGTTISLLINSWPNKILLDYSIVEQLVDLLPYLVLSATMAVIVYLIGRLQLPMILLLIIQIASGISIYITGSLLFRFEEFNDILSIVKKVLPTGSKQ